MPRVYRVMIEEEGKPKVGSEACMLGVRVSPHPHADVHLNAGGIVPRSEGLSVAPAWRLLPEHRIPKRLRSKGFPKARGKDGEYCWRMGEGPFERSAIANGLELVPDGPNRFGVVVHGILAATTPTHIDHFQQLLADTRDSWVIDED